MLATVAGFNSPSAFGEIQIIAKTKVSESQSAPKPISVANAAPDIKPRLIGLEAIGVHELVKIGMHNGWTAFSDTRLGWDQVVPAELLFINRNFKFPVLSVGAEFPINEPRNVFCWQMAGVRKPNVARQSAVKREIWPDTGWGELT